LDSKAIQTLASHNWEVEQAVTNYYESLEGGDPAAAELEVDEPDSEIEEDMRMPPNHPDGPPPTSAQSTASSNFLAGGGRRLGDDSSAPIPSTSTPISAPAPKLKKKAAKPKSKITSFKDIRDRETEEDEDDDEDKPQEFYAGGDKSGLAVTDPNSGDQGHNDQVRRLLETARRCVLSHAICLKHN
jgi:UBX domain-containing protein 1